AGFDKEPSLRILLDDMVEHPDQYRNALMINLHGELMPLPPVRNYSDAAHTLARPGVRAVTHAERLRYRGFDDVKLRVYTYLTEPDSLAPGATLDDDVVVTIPGVDVHKSARVVRIAEDYAKIAVEPQMD